LKERTVRLCRLDNGRQDIVRRRGGLRQLRQRALGPRGVTLGTERRETLRLLRRRVVDLEQRDGGLITRLGLARRRAAGEATALLPLPLLPRGRPGDPALKPTRLQRAPAPADARHLFEQRLGLGLKTVGE